MSSLRSSLDFSDPPDVGFAAGSGLTSVELRKGAEVCFSNEDRFFQPTPYFRFWRIVLTNSAIDRALTP
jgi:hypothetical protein